MSTPSEEKRLLREENTTQVRPPWLSLAIFLVFQVLIFTPGEVMMATLGVQFARSAFAREHNFVPPAVGNACTTLNESDILIEIQSETALFSVYQSILTEVIPVFTGLPLIAASDFTGRRPILLLRSAGTLAMSVGFLVVSFFDVSVYFALIGCAVFGMTGGFVLLHSVSMLYVTDIVAKDHRAVALAAIYGVQYTVIYTAPLVFNSLLGAFSNSFPIVYLILACIALIALLSMLPPSLIQEFIQKRPVESGIVSDMIWGIRHLFKTATDGRRWRIVVLLACYATIGFSMHGFQNTVNLYALGMPFCWTPSLIGIFSFVYGVPNALLAPFIVWLVELFVSDYWIIYLSILSGIAEFLLTALATTNAVLIYGASLSGIIFGISQPVYVALLTKLVAKRSYGALYSVYTLVFAITTSSSMIIQSYAYSTAVKSGHAVYIFYAMTVLSGIVFLPTILVHVLEPPDGFHPEETGSEGQDNLDPISATDQDSKSNFSSVPSH